MKRFLIKLTALILIMVVIFTAYDAAYRRICNIDPAQNDEYKFRDVPNGIQICNFGSSHGYGFDYRNWQDEFTTFNFALTMQVMSYDYRILQQYIDHIAEGGVVFILVSYFSFGWDEEAKDDFSSKNERYYSFLEPEFIKHYSPVTAVGIKHFLPLLYDPASVIRNIGISLNKKGLDGPEADDAEETGDSTARLSRTDDVNENANPPHADDEDAAFDFQSHAESKKEAGYYIVDKNGDLVVLEEELNALYGMIRLCREHSLRPVLVTVPFRKEYNGVFDEKYREQFHAVIDKVCEDESVEYYDYSHDERFVDSAEYFRNSDHLSPKGAVVFTDLMINTYVK